MKRRALAALIAAGVLLVGTFVWWIVPRAAPISAQGQTVLEACKVLGTGQLKKMVPLFKTVANSLDFGNGARVRLVGVAASRAACAILPREVSDAESVVRVRVSAVDSAEAVGRVRTAPPFPDLVNITPDLENSLRDALNGSSDPRLETTLVVTVRPVSDGYDLAPASAEILQNAVTGNLSSALGWIAR